MCCPTAGSQSGGGWQAAQCVHGAAECTCLDIKGLQWQRGLQGDLQAGLAYTQAAADIVCHTFSVCRSKCHHGMWAHVGAKGHVCSPCGHCVESFRESMAFCNACNAMEAVVLLHVAGTCTVPPLLSDEPAGALPHCNYKHPFNTLET